jgi:hypothetical protein
MHNVRYKQVRWPKDWIGHVKCPTCKEGTTGMFVATESFDGYGRPLVTHTKKYLNPCMHDLNPVQEEGIVSDMMKRGI